MIIIIRIEEYVKKIKDYENKIALLINQEF